MILLIPNLLQLTLLKSSPPFPSTSTSKMLNPWSVTYVETEIIAINASNVRERDTFNRIIHSFV